MEFNLCPFQSIVCLHDDNFQEKGEIQLATNSQKWPLMSRQVLKLEFTQFLKASHMNEWLFIFMVLKFHFTFTFIRDQNN